MDVFLAQDWLSLPNSSVNPVGVIQSEGAWLDLGAYRDVVAWLQIKRQSVNNISIAYQTAVAKEESLFATMAALTTATGSEVIVTPMLQDLQTGAALNAPLMRWFRWSSVVPAGAEFTFRLWIAANKPGRASVNRAASPR
jgi:hypothetical protein